MSKDYMKFQSVTIDYLRPLLAIMVVGLHVRPYYSDGTDMFANGLYDASIIMVFRILFSLAVPTFFLISGYLFFKNLQNWDLTIWKGKICKRAKSLLVPYILWNIIAFIGFIITRKAGQIIKGNSSFDLISLLSERGWIRIFWDRCLYGEIKPDSINLLGIAVGTGTPMNEPTWFLRDLMIVILFTPVIYFLIRKAGRLFILLTGILFCIDLWIPFTGFSVKSFFMFSLGAWFCINQKSMLDSFRRFPVLNYVSAFIFLVIASLSFNANRWIFTLSSRLFILCGIPSLFCMVSNMISVRKKEASPLFSSFVDSSFLVYLMHTVLVTDAIHWLLSLVSDSPNRVIMFVMLVLNTLLVYLTCHCFYMLLKKYSPWLLTLLTGNRIQSEKRYIL